MNRKPHYSAKLRTNLDPTKDFRLIITAGRWSWKSKSAKVCVTTHLPNHLALKMFQSTRLFGVLAGTRESTFRSNGAFLGTWEYSKKLYAYGKMQVSTLEEAPLTALVDDTTFRLVPPNVSRITHLVVGGRSPAEPDSHIQ